MCVCECMRVCVCVCVCVWCGVCARTCGGRAMNRRQKELSLVDTINGCYVNMSAKGIDHCAREMSPEIV